MDTQLIKGMLEGCILTLNEIIAIETDKDHIHFLLSYDTTDRVCDIVKIVKQETTYHLWQKYSSVLSKKYWREKTFWSDSYFACSIGEVT